MIAHSSSFCVLLVSVKDCQPQPAFTTKLDLQIELFEKHLFEETMSEGGVLELERFTLDYSTATLLNLSQSEPVIDS